MSHNNEAKLEFGKPLALILAGLVSAIFPALLPLVLTEIAYAQIISQITWGYLLGFPPAIGLVLGIIAIIVSHVSARKRDDNGKVYTEAVGLSFGMIGGILVILSAVYALHFYFQSVKPIQPPINTPVGTATLIDIKQGSNVDYPINSLFLPDSTILTYGLRRQFPVDRQPASSFLLHTNKQGAILWKRTYRGYHTRPVLAEDGTILLTFTPFRMNESFRIDRLTQSGDSLDTRYYQFSSMAAYTSIVSCRDGGYGILGGLKRDAYSPMVPFIFRINSRCDSLWMRGYPTQQGFTLGTAPAYVIETSDGGFACIGNVETRQGKYDELRIFKVDARGGLEWDNTTTPPINAQGISIVEIDKGYFVALGQKKGTGKAGKEGVFLKIDHTGRVIYQQPLHCDFSGSFTDIFPWEDAKGGGYLIVGGADLPLPPTIMTPSPDKVWSTYVMTRCAADGTVIGGFYGEQMSIRVAGAVRLDDHSLLLTGAYGSSLFYSHASPTVTKLVVYEGE